MILIPSYSGKEVHFTKSSENQDIWTIILELSFIYQTELIFIPIHYEFQIKGLSIKDITIPN